MTTGDGALVVSKRISMQSAFWLWTWFMTRQVSFLTIIFGNVFWNPGISDSLVVVFLSVYSWSYSPYLQTDSNSVSKILYLGPFERFLQISRVTLPVDQHEDEQIFQEIFKDCQVFSLFSLRNIGQQMHLLLHNIRWMFSSYLS